MMAGRPRPKDRRGPFFFHHGQTRSALPSGDAEWRKPITGIGGGCTPRAAPAASGETTVAVKRSDDSPAAGAPAASGSSERGADGPPVGGFVVQLSSQKSEGEAQSSFRSLQARFPNELGDRQPIIRRADLGSKGVFYRLVVGPFASAEEASQFCASLKAAGGQCVVPLS